MESKFKKYCEIGSIDNEKSKMAFIDKVHSLNYTGQWEVSEKIHGTNTAFFINMDGSTSFSSREEILTDADNHYNYKKVFSKINPNIDRIIKNVKEILGDKFDQYHSIVIYGELFGGCYPHPNVNKVQGAERVQKMVYYSPDNEYLVFDVVVLRDHNQNEIESINNLIHKWEAKKAEETNPSRIDEINNVINGFISQLNHPHIDYLDYDQAIQAITNTGFRMVPHIGLYDTLEEAMAVGSVFPTTVYKMFNLPEIPDNIAEGIVIKPVKYLKFNNGDRVIFKKKHSKFTEKSRKVKIPKTDITDNCADITKDLIIKASEYSNLNRLIATVSKMAGPFTGKDFGKILKAFNEDLIKDFNKDYHDDVEQVIDIGEYKIFTNKISHINSDILRANLDEIIMNSKGDI